MRRTKRSPTVTRVRTRDGALTARGERLYKAAVIALMTFGLSCGKETEPLASNGASPSVEERKGPADRVSTLGEDARPKPQKIRVRQGDKEKVLTIETKPIEDGCKMVVAQKILKAQRKKVTACAQRAGVRNGVAPNGKVIIGLALGPDGRPEKIVATQDDIKDPSFTDCLKRALDVVFPNPYQKRCLIQAPFQFSGVSSKP